MHRGDLKEGGIKKSQEMERLIEMGNTKWKSEKRERGGGIERETRKGSGGEARDGWLERTKERKMLVYLNPSVASLNHGSPVILEIAHCNSPAPRF